MLGYLPKKGGSYEKTKWWGMAYSRIIADDLEDRETGLSKPQRIGLADIAASVLSCRSVNTSELANILPRTVKSPKESYRYINRCLSNSLIDPVQVMKGFIQEIIQGLINSPDHGSF